MRLGILVSTEKHMKELHAITRAALEKGHEVSVFVMGEGVRLLVEDALGSLASEDSVDLSFCEYNAKNHSIEPMNDNLKSGSQLDNALMVRDSDRVIVL